MTYPQIIVLAIAALVAAAPPLGAQTAGPADFIPDKQPAGVEKKNGTTKFILIKPADKSCERVKADEINPFIKNVDESKLIAGKGSNEETLIQERLSKLRVCGVAPAPEGDGLRVMLGDIILSEGQIVPPVLAEQTLALKVKKITREFMQLVWLEKKYTGEPERLLTLPINLRPGVHYVLQGQIPEGKLSANKEGKGTKRANGLKAPAKSKEDEAASPAGLSRSGPAKVTATVPLKGPSSPPPPAKVAKLDSRAPAAQPLASDVKSLANAQIPDAPKSLKEGAALLSEPEFVELPPLQKTVRPIGKKIGAVVITDPLPSEKSAGQAGAPQVPASDPPQWQRALGLLENLTKIEEPKK